MAVDIEPLLRRLEALAPGFGRARVDLEAIVGRARSNDFRGVMQNARLVLETLLRSLVSEELGQTPGKAMLEELVAKFRQKGNSGIVPPNILAHMGTVQAWGNLSMHDHAGGLDETAVRVGGEEVLASLNSVVAILTWYAEKRGHAPLLDDGSPLATPAPSGGASSHSERFTPGRVVGGRYRLEARLAAGGMGEVFEATHVELGRRLALKVMRPELSGAPDFVERFRREAITASRLGHPHIVDIIDSGSEAGQFYFVMELLDGKTLSSMIDRGPVALPLALELVTQIAQALDAAHQAGVVHRDLKPDNVIVLDRAGQPFVKLMDFGVAKVVAPQDRKLTTHGVVIGTPQYMAPEQAAGLPVDARADLYNLGLMLFELLTGQPPLKGETASLVMAAHISQVAPQLPATFPAPLRSLVARMLAKQPGDRPRSMAEVLAALATVPRKPPRRALTVAALTVAGLVVAVAGLALARRPAPTAPSPPALDPVRAAPTPVEAVAPGLPDSPAPVAEPEPEVTTRADAELDAGVAALPKRPPVKRAPKRPAPPLLPADGL